VSGSLARFLLQFALIVAAAAVAAVAHLSAVAIAGVVAGAFGVGVLSEFLVAHRRTERRQARSLTAPAERRTVVVRTPKVDRRRPRPPVDPREWEPVRQRWREPSLPAVAPGSKPASAHLRPAPPRVRVEAASPEPFRPAPVAAPAGAPEAPAPQPSAATPSAEEAPAALPPAAPAPQPPPVAPAVVERRRWNVFDLENRARRAAGADPAADEERTFLFLYLREFADISGDLPEHFDPFVRDSFADLI
jgi:hypothetical protein